MLNYVGCEGEFGVDKNRDYKRAFQVKEVREMKLRRYAQASRTFASLLASRCSSPDAGSRQRELAEEPGKLVFSRPCCRQVRRVST
jgi:hypothetical protein